MRRSIHKEISIEKDFENLKLKEEQAELRYKELQEEYEQFESLQALSDSLEHLSDQMRENMKNMLIAQKNRIDKTMVDEVEEPINEAHEDLTELTQEAEKKQEDDKKIKEKLDEITPPDGGNGYNEDPEIYRAKREIDRELAKDVELLTEAERQALLIEQLQKKIRDDRMKTLGGN